MPSYTIRERLEWQRWVTPKPLKTKPVHRWYTFPHSFTNELVHALIEEWNLGKDDYILDPFVGAGTTLLAAKEKSVPATGYDLSPIAVFVTAAKLFDYDLPILKNAWNKLKGTLDPSQWNESAKRYSELIYKALPGKLLGAFEAVDQEIANLSVSDGERSFFRLALIATIPRYSRAVATGGWLKWVEKEEYASTLLSALSNCVHIMLEDIRETPVFHHSLWHVFQADARALPDATRTYSAVITSPPYPNRHDYTRVFGVELMFGFLNWEETRQLRYQSFHSHPEARPKRPETTEYRQPHLLTHTIAQIQDKTKNPRIPRMLEGYFLDMYLSLREVRRVCRGHARIAFVVGNAQYYGEPILVDELTAEIGEQAGLYCKDILVARYRGNSAQQMGKYGRNLSRESIVVFNVL